MRALAASVLRQAFVATIAPCPIRGGVASAATPLMMGLGLDVVRSPITPDSVRCAARTALARVAPSISPIVSGPFVYTITSPNDVAFVVNRKFHSANNAFSLGGGDLNAMVLTRAECRGRARDRDPVSEACLCNRNTKRSACQT